MPSFVITGASTGLGFQYVKQLLTGRTNVVIGLVNSGEDTRDLLALQASTKNMHVFELRSSDPKSLKAAAKAVSVTTCGKLDVLIINPGPVQDVRGGLSPDAYPEDQEDLLEADLHDFFKRDVVATVHTINAFLPLLRATASFSTAKVVATSCAFGDMDFTAATGFSGALSYSVAKAALNLLMAKYAARFEEENIAFVSISPGMVNTLDRAPTAEEMEAIMNVILACKRALPEWDGNPITPAESVGMTLDVIQKISSRDNGAFVSHFGDRKWL